MASNDTPATISALGAGRMGQGIAHAFAYAGHPVQLVDMKPRDAEQSRLARDKAFAEIRANLTTLAGLELFAEELIETILARIRYVSLDEAPEHLGSADVVFEGVPEVMDAKREAFATAATYLPDDAIIASTTSTFLSTDVAKHVPGPERFLNAHWLNPAFLIPLVELSPHAGTDEGVVRRLQRLLEEIGKVPVVCAAAPGYIVPRFQTLIMNEAARMIEQGIATAEDIDRATRYGFGIRYAGMGVVEFIDFGGNDILHYASEYLAGALDDERYRAPEIVGRYMREGRNGLRDGRGFYDWEGRDTDQYRRDAMQRLIDLIGLQDKLPKPAE